MNPCTLIFCTAFRARWRSWLKVNWSPENKNEALLARWPRIQGYPHLFVLDGDGKLLHSQETGSLESGRDYDKARFLAFLRAWIPPRAT